MTETVAAAEPRLARFGLAIFAPVVLSLGLGFGLVPVSATMAGHDVTCGAPWAPDYHAADVERFGDTMAGRSTTDRRQQCRDELGGRGTLGALLAGLGGVGLVGVIVLAATRRPRES